MRLRLYCPMQPNPISPLIGPHEGRELALMLEGRKKLAVFHEMADRADAMPEEVIPEKAFAPHVAAGCIIRRSADIPTSQGAIRYICFCLPDEEWRIDAFLFIKADAIRHRQIYAGADDVLVGRLLSYTDEEINTFLKNRTNLKTQSV